MKKDNKFKNKFKGKKVKTIFPVIVIIFALVVAFWIDNNFEYFMDNLVENGNLFQKSIFVIIMSVLAYIVCVFEFK